MTADERVLQHALPAPSEACRRPRRRCGKRPHVTIRGLSKRFDKAVIYDNFDLDMPRGELISVFGPNGCGKSTLINMIAGLIPLDDGEILFDGMLLERDQVRLCVPELSRGAVSLAARVRQHRLSAQDDEGAASRSGSARVEKLVAHLGVKLDLNPLPLPDVGRPAAARLDHARAGRRAGDPVSRRAVLRARLRDDAVHARAIAAHLHGDRHHHGAGVARSRRGGLSRRPGAAAVAPSGAGRRFRAGRRRRGRASTDTLSDAEFVRIKAHCLEVFQREVRRA